MMERMMGIGYPPNVGRFRPEQIAQQKTWTKVPEDQRVNTSITIIHMVPANGSTETFVNPLDPGDGCYYNKPADYGRLPRAGIWR